MEPPTTTVHCLPTVPSPVARHCCPLALSPFPDSERNQTGSQGTMPFLSVEIASSDAVEGVVYKFRRPSPKPLLFCLPTTSHRSKGHLSSQLPSAPSVDIENASPVQHEGDSHSAVGFGGGAGWR